MRIRVCIDLSVCPTVGSSVSSTKLLKIFQLNGRNEVSKVSSSCISEIHLKRVELYQFSQRLNVGK